MKGRIFAVEIQQDQTLQISFDIVVPLSNIAWIKENLGHTIDLEELKGLDSS